MSTTEVLRVRTALLSDSIEQATLLVQLAPTVLTAAAAILRNPAVPMATGFHKVAPFRRDCPTGRNPHLHSYELIAVPEDGWLFAWTALQDVTLDAGPMWLAPGSHQQDHALHAHFHGTLEALHPGEHDRIRRAFAAGPSEGDLPKILENYHDVLRRTLRELKVTPRPVLLSRGDAILFQPGIIHGTLPPIDIKAPAERLSCVTRYASASATLYAKPPWYDSRLPDIRMKLDLERKTIQGQAVYLSYVHTRLRALGVRVFNDG